MRFRHRAKTEPARSAVSVYLRGRRYIVISSAELDVITVWAPPVVSLPEDVSDEELGSAVTMAADAAVVVGGDAEPDNVNALRAATLEQGGFKDVADVERHAKLLNVERQDKALRLARPRRYRGGGWAGDIRDGDLRQTLGPSTTSAQLGAAVRRLLEPPTRHSD